MERPLTQKQENFRNDLFAGIRQRDAYINHYNTQNMLSATIDRCAHQLARNPKIATSLEEMRQAAKSALIADEIERKEILTEIYRGRIGNYLDEGQRIKQGANLDSAAIQEVATEEVKIGRGEYAKLVTITKIKLLNPIQAIAEHNKMDGLGGREGGGDTFNIITKEVIIDAREKLGSAIARLATRIRETEGSSKSE